MLKRVQYSFTRPSDTDAYSDEDLVANSTTAGSVTPMSWKIGGVSGGELVHARLTKTDGTDVANATFSLYLFGASPTVTNGDNGALAFPVASTYFLGFIPFAIMLAGSDDGYTVLRLGDTGFLSPIACPHSTVYGLLKAEAAYAPASAEVFTCDLTFRK